MALRVYADRHPEARGLLVLLPGAGDSAQLFLRHGFVAQVRERGWPVDVLAVEANSDLYLDKSVLHRLHEEVIGPELAARPRPLWLAGISLGGAGASLYARAHPGAVAGLLLLAPFFAVRGTIAEVTRAGGLDVWQPGQVTPDDDERGLLAWLKAWRVGEPARYPPIWLGYGLDDRYAPASALLAARLPGGHLHTCPGGHDWAAWTQLWPRLLDSAGPSLPG